MRRYEATIPISKEKCDELQRLLNMKKIDFKEEKIKPNSILDLFQVVFDNGYYAKISVRTNGASAYIENILYNNDGIQTDFGLLCDQLEGSYYFEVDNNIYKAVIKLKQG